jgi:hypothetical protein
MGAETEATVGNTTINYDYEAASPAVEVSAIMK